MGALFTLKGKNLLSLTQLCVCMVNLLPVERGGGVNILISVLSDDRTVDFVVH